MSERLYGRDETNWVRLRARAIRFVRTRTTDQWIMFLAGAVVGAFLA
ncbi:MAG: hypothetical protein HQ495_04775 [Alphaproteobacteria bacterium]|nr:hypothetical protein [Alphaproteobacteria bacterium]